MRVERTVRTFVIGAVLAGAALASATVALGQETKPTLYKRLGGYDALAAVTDDFLGRLAADPSLGRFFVGTNKEHLGRIRQLVVDQLCAATGGPCIYIGRDMKTAHEGLAITDADWDTAVKLLNATLDKFKVPKAEQDEVRAAIGGMKKDIVAPKP
jgi:hemoglobin